MNTDSMVINDLDRERLEARIKEHPLPIGGFLPHWVEECITEGEWLIKPETKTYYLRLTLAFCDGRAQNQDAPKRNEDG